MEDIICELSKRYNKKKELIEVMIKGTMNEGYTLEESVEIIEAFYKK